MNKSKPIKRFCAYKKCSCEFIIESPNQRYCTDECVKNNREQKEAQKREVEEADKIYKAKLKEAYENAQPVVYDEEPKKNIFGVIKDIFNKL